MKYGLNLLVILLASLMLVACGDNHRRWDPNAYSVVKGDTLYSIAWRYEMDYRDIAEWNSIKPPYAIYPGQRLAMQAVSMDGTRTQDERPRVIVESTAGHVIISGSASGKPEQTGAVTSKPAKIVVKKNDTLYSIARREGFSHHQLARWNYLKPPYLLKPGQSIRLKPPASSLGSGAPVQSGVVINKVARSDNSASSANTSVKPVPASSRLPRNVASWQWPVNGKVVKTFRSNDTSRKGIGIRGKLNQPIIAAASGRVVYSGNGLINYGNLIIIKHSHNFLSAYAHNNALLVKEGDNVKPGQAIAKMGKQDSGKPQLHFEIRRNGKPVNPLQYLPRS